MFKHLKKTHTHTHTVVYFSFLFLIYIYVAFVEKLVIFIGLFYFYFFFYILCKRMFPWLIKTPGILLNSIFKFDATHKKKPKIGGSQNSSQKKFRRKITDKLYIFLYSYQNHPLFLLERICIIFFLS